MGFFQKLSVKVNLEERGQEIELYPIPIKKFKHVMEISQKFDGARLKNDKDNIKLAVEEMSKLIQEYSNIPTVEDVKELAIFEIGFIFGQLTEYSQNPKANAVTGQTQAI